MGRVLEERKLYDAGVLLLDQARKKHPGDFWLEEMLGISLLNRSSSLVARIATGLPSMLRRCDS